MKNIAHIAIIAAGVTPCLQASDLISDSTAQLQARNFYFDRDFRSGAGQSQAQEWAQGFILNFASGYTPGDIGFGVDGLAMLGIKLDSGPGRTGTGILSYDPSSREVNDEYSKWGVTAKAKFSKTELRFGTMQPAMPIALANTMRLFPPLLDGIYLRSQELDGLTFHAARFNKITLRDSTNRDDFYVSGANKRFNTTATTDELSIVGADYRWSDRTTTRYYHAQLPNLYSQDYFDLVNFLPIGASKLKSDIRLFDSREDGQRRAGTVDNQTLSSMFTFQTGIHSLGVGYMKLWGDSALPYVGGTSVNVNSEGLLVSDFVNTKESTWQLRYDYDFVAAGVPGLKFMWRYLKGRDAEVQGFIGGSEENERDIELSYAFQGKTFNGLGLRIRQADYKSDFARDANELRINVDYTFKLW